MNKLSIKSIVEFRRKKTDQSKKTLLLNLKKPKQVTEEKGPGGNYWVRSLSAIGGAFRFNKIQLVKNKISEIQDNLEIEKRTQTRVMYERNIAILRGYEGFDLGDWQP